MSVTAAPSIPVAIIFFLFAIVLRTISIILSGEMPMKKLLSLINVKFLLSVVTETVWTGLAGIAVSAEYMSE